MRRWIHGLRLAFCVLISIASARGQAAPADGTRAIPPRLVVPSAVFACDITAEDRERVFEVRAGKKFEYVVARCIGQCEIMLTAGMHRLDMPASGKKQLP